MELYHLLQDDFDRIISAIQSLNNNKVIICVRGLPGMGKSTLGKNLIELFNDTAHVENDQQFMINGEYVFDESKLDEIHLATQNKVEQLMLRNTSKIVVTNTFTMKWELNPYRNLAEEFNYDIIELDLLLYVVEHAIPNRNSLISYLYKNNLHSLSKEKLEIMLDRYELSDYVLLYNEMKLNY